MAYNVSTADIEARWRSLSDAESDVATTLIDDAIALLDTYRSGLAAAVASGRVAERLVVMTVADAVIRVLTNPDIWSNQSVTADGGVSIGWQFARSTPAPRMRLSDLDLAALDRALAAVGVRTGRTGSLRMVASTRWSQLNFGSSDGEPTEADWNAGFLVFPGQSDSLTMSDSYSIVLQ